MTLLSLPLELLQQIAACVDTVHRPSLYTFSLACKACHRASASLIFREINFTTDRREGLRHDAERIIETLFRTDSARHVQCLSIQGTMELNPKKAQRTGRISDWWKTSSGLAEILDDEEQVCYSGLYVVYDEPVIEESSEEDMAWAPVVSLLRAIPRLKDLVYDCDSQFPPSLLNTLLEQHPQCRLHHLNFRFRTLLWGVPYPYEMKLATLPSLYRVKLAWTPRDTDGDDDFNMEAMMELAAGLAPNLKEVVILNIFAARSSRYRRPRDSWKGLPGFTSKAVGSLTSLSLKGYSDLNSPEVLKNWSRHTDFACLQHLALEGSYEQRQTGLSGETMEWVAQNQSFPRLRTLSVYLSRDDSFNERPHYSENAVSFFRAFESLEELSVHGPLDSHIVDAILSHHGQKLKKLVLRPFEELTNWDNARQDRRDIPLEFSKDRILQIEAKCPVLEELAIPVKRNKSSACEAELYRCLAKMKSLRFLFLILDCSNWRVVRDSTYDPHFDEEDQKPVECSYSLQLKWGNVKETLINCAVDDALARSIWKTISQNKTGGRLERLKLWTTGGGVYGGRGSLQFENTIVENLSRSWLIERDPRDDREAIVVRELGHHGIDVRDIDVRRSHESEAGQVFRSIWPPKEGSKDWRDDWSSFPLQV